MIDVVVVAYRSGAHLRDCVTPLLGQDDVRVIVVDNACPERSTELLGGDDVEVVRMSRNAGFAVGSNSGARLGSADTILFLNPDAQILPESARRLARRLERDHGCAAVGPHIFETTGESQPSMRRAPRLRSALGEALFLHHVFRRARWPTEIVRDGYDVPSEAEWLSGAVLAVRRSAFETVGGFDERFFLYSEDADLCARLRGRGFSVVYDPEASAVHEGGGSAPRPLQAALRTDARLLYARLHERPLRYQAFRICCVLHTLLRLPLSAARSRTHLRGSVAALAAALGRKPIQAAPRETGSAA